MYWIMNRNTTNNTNEISEEGLPSIQPSIITLSQALEQKKKDQKLPGWFETQQISEKYSYERYIEITLKELIIYIIFYVLLCFAIFSYSIEDDFYYQYIIKRMYEDTKFRCGNETQLISMTDVRTMEQYWCYMQNFLVASFYWKFWYSSRDKVAITLPEDDNILYNNYLVGVPRIRQVRVTNTSCEIHDAFKARFKHCYGFYSFDTEERGKVTPINDGVTGNETCWSYSTAEELDSLPYSGQLAKYYGGGFYLDLTLDEETDNEALFILEENLWLSRATRAIFIDFATLNINTDSLCFIKLLFEFHPTGGVYPSTSFYLIKLNRFYLDLEHYGLMVLIYQILIVLFTIYFILMEINEYTVLKFKSYFASWWTTLDLTILVFLLLTIFGHIILCFLVRYNVTHNLNVKSIDQKSYRSFDNLISWHSILSFIVSWTLFVAALKFLRLLKIFHLIRNLYGVIFQASSNILAFAILFSTIILASGLIANLQFGDQVYGLHRVSTACSSLVLALVGHFDLQALIEYDTWIGSTFCYFYIFLVFFIVTNIIIAILNERYWLINRILSRENDEDLWEPLRFKLQTLLYKMGCQGCASKWYKNDQMNKSERKYNSLKDEFARRTGATQEEAEEFLRNANVTKKNAAIIPNDEIRNLMKTGGAELDKELNMRVFQLEKEIKRLMKLNSRK